MLADFRVHHEWTSCKLHLQHPERRLQHPADFRESFDFNLHGKLIDKKISVFSGEFAKDLHFLVWRGRVRVYPVAWALSSSFLRHLHWIPLTAWARCGKNCMHNWKYLHSSFFVFKLCNTRTMLKSITPSPCYIACLVSLILPCYNYDTCLSRINMARKLAHVTFTENQASIVSNSVFSCWS